MSDDWILGASDAGEAEALPKWVNRVADWIKARARLLLVVVAVAQLLILAGMVGLHALPLLVGRTVLLKVVPVDPRDLFRGDYVILSYDVNRLGDRTIEGIANRRSALWYDDQTWLQGRTIYTTIEPDADGHHWHAVRTSVNRPSQGVYLKGRYARDWRSELRYGIEAYYVQEGSGGEFEASARNHSLSAEIAVAPWGQATLKRLVIEGKE